MIKHLSAMAAAMTLTTCTTADKVKVAEDVVAIGCTVVEALADDVTVHQICATEQELADLVDDIRSMRAEAGPAYHVANCRIIPHTTMCAMRWELVMAIDDTLAKRARK